MFKMNIIGINTGNIISSANHAGMFKETTVVFYWWLVRMEEGWWGGLAVTIYLYTFLF